MGSYFGKIVNAIKPFKTPPALIFTSNKPLPNSKPQIQHSFQKSISRYYRWWKNLWAAFSFPTLTLQLSKPPFLHPPRGLQKRALCFIVVLWRNVTSRKRNKCKLCNTDCAVLMISYIVLVFHLYSTSASWARGVQTHPAISSMHWEQPQSRPEHVQWCSLHGTPKWERSRFSFLWSSSWPQKNGQRKLYVPKSTSADGLSSHLILYLPTSTHFPNFIHI